MQPDERILAGRTIRLTIGDGVRVEDTARVAIRKPLLTVREVAASRGVSRQRILQLLSAGRIEGAYQLGDGTWVIPKGFKLERLKPGPKRK